MKSTDWYLIFCFKDAVNIPVVFYNPDTKIYISAKGDRKMRADVKKM